MLEPEYFYKPAHAHVFAAIADLHARGIGADVVTVADELRINGLLEDIGGPSTLISLQAGTPATSNAGRYAEIIARDARRRRLIASCGNLAEAAYDGNEERAMTLLADATASSALPGTDLVFGDLGAVLRHEAPAIKPEILFRSDGQALVYPGLLHWVYGEPESGKTWFALLASLSLMRNAIPVGYLDYEGTEGAVGGRLEALGAKEPDVEFIRYQRPTLESRQLGAAMAKRVREEGLALVVIDGCAKALAREGLDEDRASELLGWLDRLVWPICGAGAAVMVLDHVVKEKDARGRWARGTGAKMGEVDGAAYRLETRESWSRNKPGWSAIMLGKDREGVVGATGEMIGRLRMQPDDGKLRAWVDVPPESTAAALSTAREAVIRVIEELPIGQRLTQRQLEDKVKPLGKWGHDIIRNQAQSLAKDGFISRITGQNRAFLYGKSQADDPALDEDF